LEANGSVGGEEAALPGDEELKLACEYELKLFLQSNGLTLRKANKKEYNDPLPWWNENASKYPILAPLAQLLFLYIPASSAPSERVWSQAALVLPVKRANTTDDVIIRCHVCKREYGATEEALQWNVQKLKGRSAFGVYWTST
jgi:hypothetical protein